MNRSAKAVATVVAVVAISACGGARAAQVRPAPTPPTTTTGSDFLPHYLNQLQGKEPLPKDRCPDPRDLRELLVPCDLPDRP